MPERASVEAIPEKDAQFENTVTIDEFNSLVKTVRGLYNFFNGDQHQIGINEPEPASTLTLDVEGRIGAREYCDENGENCINPATWDARPALDLQPPGARCVVGYRTKDQKYESAWQETGSNNEAQGPEAFFNSGLTHNCAGAGCGVQMRLRCTPNPNLSSAAACRLRYRLNHADQSQAAPWVTTDLTTGNDWAEGDWSLVQGEALSWGNGLSLQTGIDCQTENLRCQVGQKLHNERESSAWKISDFTTNDDGWQDSEFSLLSGDTARACDQRRGCGVQVQARCTGATSVLKTPLFSCPRARSENCPTQCEGQISLSETCSYQKQNPDKSCQILLTETCEKIGYLVQ